MNLRSLFPCTILAMASLILPANAENLEQTQQLINTKQCHQCDLSSTGLVYAKLAGADVSRANLSQANLSRADLSNANLQGANLSGAVLFSANLSGANLQGADLSNADLRGAILSGANLDGATLTGTDLLGAVGLPSVITTPENLYIWGLAEAQRGNYRGAIANFNDALSRKPDFAHAILARGISRFQLGDRPGALLDSQRAEQLYLTQADEQGHQAALQFSQGLVALQAATEAAQKHQQGGGGGNFLGLLGSLSSLLLRFVVPGGL